MVPSSSDEAMGLKTRIVVRPGRGKRLVSEEPRTAVGPAYHADSGRRKIFPECTATAP
jgi:hypothetical protein